MIGIFFTPYGKRGLERFLPLLRSATFCFFEVGRGCTFCFKRHSCLVCLRVRGLDVSRPWRDVALVGSFVQGHIESEGVHHLDGVGLPCSVIRER